ncbi:hypothetical protein [Paenibacillus illinoisensis]|uniref:hypothetical protein n=1 Tax=Paenibacillus illinoisensis TaxID=59845 RepID=UPI00301A2063
MLKRGYQNGERVIEIIEGNVDLVLYNDKGTSFYFYRFPPDVVFKESIPAGLNVISQIQIREMLERNGITDYKGLLNRLLEQAWEDELEARYEM